MATISKRAIDQIVDLFAGPGGWEWALRLLGLEATGVEWDNSACKTRRVVGYTTVQADVATLDPADFRPLRGVIGSPPCPTFSMAGGGGGRLLVEIIVRCLHEIAAGNDTRAERREEAYRTLEPVYLEKEREKAKAKDREPDRDAARERARRDATMSLLVVEPLRFIVGIGPAWVALEEVPDVLPIWTVMAEILGTLGYSTWAGVLEAERYGVPQTRERAILMAHREQQVVPPPPTHQRYVPGESATGELTLEGELLPWVSMAEALGWDRADRAGFPRLPDVHYRNGNQENATRRPVTEPAPTLHFGHALNSGVEWTTTPDEPWQPSDVVVDTGNTRGGTRPEGRERGADEPAVSITSRADQLERRAYGGRGQKDGRTGKPNRKRQIDEPAPTIAGESRNDPWVGERPATTVAGDPRVHPPGHKENSNDPPGKFEQRRGENAIRVSLEEAAVLQGFPPDYPFQGTRTRQFEQVGNAVPPPLAQAVLAQLVDAAERREAA